jgi:hypothetical protein
VRPGRNLDLAPSEQDIGMMSLLFGQFANPVHESQRGLEIGKLVGASDVMFVDNLPLRGIG